MFGLASSFARRTWITALGLAVASASLAACGSSASPSSGAASGSASGSTAGLTSITIGTPNAAYSPQSINFEIADYLGYYKQQGLSVTIDNLGTPQGVLSALSTGRIDFAILPDATITATVAGGQAIKATAFYEFAYPFKYGVAVNPSSGISSISQLKGKTIGTDSFGQSEYNVGQVLLTESGVSENQVHWLATGLGVASGQALQRNRIAGLFYSDAGFGLILAAGIPMKFLPLPPGVPQVGGQFVLASDKVWNSAAGKAQAAKLATAIGEASTFIQANPTAAAYAYLKQVPTAAEPGEALSKQIAGVELPVRLRMKLFTPPSGLKLGQVNPQNFSDAITFQKLKPFGISSLYSNAVIAAANSFSVAKIQQQAKSYKVPGITGQVPVVSIPAGTP
jgi:NitT/TauT family transport system substrate-binding protein